MAGRRREPAARAATAVIAVQSPSTWQLPDRVRAAIERRAGEASFETNPCFYLYDMDLIAERMTRTASALPPPFEIYYAMKANPFPAILELAAEHPGIAGIDVSSGGELSAALRFFAPSRVSFTGPAKLPVELREALAAGIGRFHIESLTEARRLSAHGRGPISSLVRLNLENADPVTRDGNQFGVDDLAAVAEIARLPGLAVEGIHAFPGSGILESAEATEFAKRVLALAAQLEAEGIPMRAANLGGGFGIDYSGESQFDVARYGAAVATHPMTENLDAMTVDLGRFLVAPGGYYVTEIIDIKRARGSVHLIVAGGINHQRRPYAHACNMPLAVVPRNGSKRSRNPTRVENLHATINGPTLARYDVLGRDVWIDTVDIGDLIVLGLAGAYGLNLAPVEFLLRPRAPEYTLDATAS